MNNRIVFNDAAHLEIQGSEAMYLIELRDDLALYELANFSVPKVIIADYRQSGLKAIQHVVETDDTAEFPYQFNQPSHLTLIQNTKEILIELRETDQSNPGYMLWVAMGYRGRLPVYDYIYKNVVTSEDFPGSSVIFALYKRPKRHKKIHPLYSSLAR